MQEGCKMERIDISFAEPQPCVIGDTVTVKFNVDNDTPDELPEQRLQQMGDSYWRFTCSAAVPKIEPYSSCRGIKLTMRCRQTQDPAAVPHTFKVRLEKSKIERVFQWRFWSFTKALRDYNPAGQRGALSAEKYVLLCFGLAGSGKSSFYNSVLTLMHQGNDVVNTVPSGGSTDHNTTQLQKYDVEDANFCLCDVWGLDKDNYKKKSKILPALLEGWLPNNWKMEYQLRDHKAILLANDASRYQRRVHAVLFFITAAAVHDDQEMATVKEAFQLVKRREYQPVVVLSQADRECTECRNKTLSEYPALTELKNKAATALGIAPKDVIHGVNYTDSTTRDFEIDRLTYKILDMALHNACNFCQVARKLEPMQDLISEGFEDASTKMDFGTEMRDSASFARSSSAGSAVSSI